jgi:hypothetical protein
MDTRNVCASARSAAVALVALLFVAACGGSSSPEPEVEEKPTTGTVGLLFTDMPTELFDSIVLTVSGASLIGGDDSHHVLFDSAREIDLLDLTNYSEPVVFGEVMVGSYTKIRLQLDSIELFPKDGDSFFIEKLPANGKVDLLHPDGFDVLPGRTLMIEIDVDANKSIKITGAGKSGKVNFRPVVRVEVYDTGMPHKLARLEGYVSGEPTDPTFVLCKTSAEEFCVDVATGDTTSIFNDEGFVSDFTSIEQGDMVVVIGEYSTDPIVLNALVVANGPDVEQVTGRVSDPSDSQFMVLTIDGVEYTVELQAGTTGTKFYDANGPIPADTIGLADKVEVEGVVPPDADPKLIRAAFVFLEPEPTEQLSGTIAPDTLDPDSFSFELTTSEGPVCVFADEASIVLVDTAGGIVSTGEFGDLVDDQAVDVYGAMGIDACFEAEEVVAEVPTT